MAKNSACWSQLVSRVLPLVPPLFSPLVSSLALLVILDSGFIAACFLLVSPIYLPSVFPLTLLALSASDLVTACLLLVFACACSLRPCHSLPPCPPACPAYSLPLFAPLVFPRG